MARSARTNLALIMAILSLMQVSGCSVKIKDQLNSLQGMRTEDLRDWVRNDPSLDKVIIFVHGFNSSKEEAWGQWPILLKNDDEFKEFNVHHFGYPTKLCRQVSDIRNQGEFLASFLLDIFNSTNPKYRKVVVVGHSMGGLVILQALLKLERDHLKILTDENLTVLTFGTPCLGVENTDALELLCDNKQVNDMHLLNDTLGELGRDFSQRFNQSSGPGGRQTPQVRLYAFRGTEDRFITKTSACGYPQIPCESVDGDHNSIVKPKDRTHLAYQKLKSTSLQSYPKTAAEPRNDTRIRIKGVLAVPMSESGAPFPVLNIYYDNAGIGVVTGIVTRFAAGIGTGLMSDEAIVAEQDKLLRWDGWKSKMDRRKQYEMYPGDAGEFTSIPSQEGELAELFRSNWEKINAGTSVLYVFIAFKYFVPSGEIAATENCFWISGGFARHNCGRGRSFIEHK